MDEEIKDKNSEKAMKELLDIDSLLPFPSIATWRPATREAVEKEFDDAIKNYNQSVISADNKAKELAGVKISICSTILSFLDLEKDPDRHPNLDNEAAKEYFKEVIRFYGQKYQYLSTQT